MFPRLHLETEKIRQKEEGFILNMACYQQSREKKASKMEQSGLSAEELLRQQQELFASAGQKFNAGSE